MAQPTNTASIDLCTKDDVRRFKGVPADEDFAPNLGELIERASRWIEAWCGRRFLYETHTQEVVDGDGRESVFLPHPPLDAVTVYQTYTAGPTWFTESITEGVVLDAAAGEYGFRDGTVIPYGRANVRFTYTSGFATTTNKLPPDVVQAAAELTSTFLERADLLSFARPSLETVDGQSIQFQTDAIPRSVLEVVRRYRIFPVGSP